MMSHPVFVLDAAGTPLMPVAPAYARRLLTQGKARQLQHLGLVVLQLSHVIAQPAARPVLLAITLHNETVDMYLVADGKQRPLTLMRMLLSVPTHIHRRMSQRRGRRTQVSRNRRATHIATLVSAVINELQRIVPLRYVLTPEAKVCRGLRLLTPQHLVVMSPGHIPGAASPELVELLRLLPTRCPTYCVGTLSLLPAETLSNSLIMCRTGSRLGNEGILYRMTRAGRIILKLPQTQHGHRVSWHHMALPDHARTTFHPVGPLVFVPLGSKRKQPDKQVATQRAES